MRTNLTGFALTVGMGLIVLLMGFGLLSAAGLVGFAASDTFAVQAMPMAEDSLAAKSGASVATAYVPASAEEAEAIKVGDALFKANCTQCHAVNEKVVGPALAGITKRRPISWIVPWVKNSAKVVASGDVYAVKLFDDNGKQQMPSFILSKKEIENIVAWVESQEGSFAMIDDSSLFSKVE